MVRKVMKRIIKIRRKDGTIENREEIITDPEEIARLQARRHGAGPPAPGSLPRSCRPQRSKLSVGTAFMKASI